MKVFVAKNYDGYIVGIAIADDRKLVDAYWQGQELYPHSVVEYDECILEDHITGVIGILKTKEKALSGFGRDSAKYICVDK